MSLVLEKDIEDRFVEWVEKKGGIILKWTGSRKKFDRVIITHTGRVMLLEFKRPGGRTTPHQAELLAQIAEVKRRGIQITTREFCPVYKVDSFKMAREAYNFVANDLWLP